MYDRKCKKFTGIALEECKQQTRIQIEKEDKELQEIARQQSAQAFHKMMEVHINKYSADLEKFFTRSEWGTKYLSEAIQALTDWALPQFLKKTESNP